MAVKYYNLGNPNEVDQLFALMLFGYFYISIPLCVMCALGLTLVRKKLSITLNASYIFLCIIFVPIVFYGVGVSNYYG